ncbi:MAG TPA: T9SS type A sorting domain-containing protein [Bacteroidia bacterium]|nr:T9SS type A sorting domain-containing protein [Bacteroidia bacterium]
MRNTFTLIAFVLLGLGAQAQLTRADFPDVGNSQVYRRGDSISPGPSGSGQNWNFGSIGHTSQVATNQYITPSAHAQGASFPTANLCSKPFNDDFKFYEAGADSIYLIGEKSVANTRVTYTDGARLYSFPQAMGVANIDSVHGQYPDGFISNVTRKGWYQTVFDGDGQLTTPYATYPSVKRVEISASFQDSSWLGAADGELSILRYEWYAAGEPMPVFVVHNQIFVLNGGNPSVTYEVWYADPNAVAATEGSFANLEIFPNPTEGNSQLSYRLDAADEIEITVSSILGDRVKTIASGEQAAGNYQYDLGTQGLAKGIYLVNMRSSQGSVTRKLVLN